MLKIILSQVIVNEEIMYKPDAPEPEQDTRHRSKIMQEEHPKLFRFVPK